MKVSSCIKKVEKALGKKMNNNGSRFWVEYEGKIISFFPNGFRASDPAGLDGDAVNFHVRSVNDESDPYTDYHAGSFRSNITQLIHSIKPPEPKFSVGSLVRGKNNKRASRQGYAGKVGLVTTAGEYSRIDWIGEPRKTMYNTYPERDLELVSGVAS
jgi:hypothetical protein